MSLVITSLCKRHYQGDKTKSISYFLTFSPLGIQVLLQEVYPTLKIRNLTVKHVMGKDKGEPTYQSLEG